MPFTLAGAPLQTATVRIPRFGAMSADVSTVDTLELAAGARVSLLVGDLVLVMTVQNGGTFAGQSSYSLLGGAGRWGAQIPPKEHRSDQGITVLEVARDLITDAGELGVVLEAGAERPLGYTWVRRAGIAADALEQLAGDAWWTAPDGVTHLGPRPARAISPATLTVQAYDPATRRATVALEDDAIAQLLPGATLTNPGLPAPLEVGGCVLRVADGALEVDLIGERPPSELLSAIVKLLQGRALLAAPQLYQVDSDGQGRTTAHAAGPAAAALPDQPGIDRCYGLPGARADLQAGALVAVVCLDGSPGAPRVGAYLPGVLPAMVGLDATTSIQFGAAAAVRPLSRADLTDGALTTLITALNALCVATGHAGLQLLGVPSTACAKVQGE